MISFGRSGDALPRAESAPEDHAEGCPCRDWESNDKCNCSLIIHNLEDLRFHRLALELLQERIRDIAHTIRGPGMRRVGYEINFHMKTGRVSYNIPAHASCCGDDWEEFPLAWVFDPQWNDKRLKAIQVEKEAEARRTEEQRLRREQEREAAELRELERLKAKYDAKS